MFFSIRLLMTQSNIPDDVRNDITDLPEEEIQERRKEDELFSKLTSVLPTKLDGVSDILGEAPDEKLLEQREKSKKQQAASVLTKSRKASKLQKTK